MNIRPIFARPFVRAVACALALSAGAAARGGTGIKLSPDLAAQETFGGYAVSPTSAHAAFKIRDTNTSKQRVYAVPLSGSPSVEVSVGVSDVGFGVLQFSSGGTRVLFNTYVFDHGNDWDLYSAPVGGGLAVKLNGDVNFDPDPDFLFTSPDDSRAVFMSEERQVYSTLQVGGPIDQLSTPLVPNGVVDHTTPPAVTPGTTRLLFNNRLSTSSFNDAALVVRAIDGSGAQVRIGEALNLYSDTFNDLLVDHGGHRVFFAANPNFFSVNPKLYAAAVDGSGTPVEISNDGTTVVTGIGSYRVSPNDAAVVFDGNFAAELYAAPAAGGTIQKLTATTAHASFALSQAISPDSSRVVYVGDKTTDNKIELYAVPIAGGASLKLNDALPANGDVRRDSVVMTPDGSRVIYRADRDVDERFEIYSVAIDGGPVVKLNDPGSQPTMQDTTGAVPLSGDGRFAIFSQNTGAGMQVWAVPVAGGTMYPVTEPGISNFQLTPDGQRVVYLAAGNTQLWAVGVPVTELAPGQGVVGEVGGGLGFPGGIGFDFDDVSGGGILQSQFLAEPLEHLDPELLESIDFALSGDTPQLWDLTFDGSFAGLVQLTFTYNEQLLAPGVNEASLEIHHQLAGGEWELLPTLARDLDLNTITVATSGFSNFALGVPEPSTWVLALLAACGLPLALRCRRHLGDLVR